MALPRRSTQPRAHVVGNTSKLSKQILFDTVMGVATHLQASVDAGPAVNKSSALLKVAAYKKARPLRQETKNL